MLLKNVLTSILLCSSSLASEDLVPPRIAKTTVDKRLVQKLFIAHGRSSTLIFPCNIRTFSPGPTNDISASVNERDSKILDVWFSNSANQPAGLKVICNDNYFVFAVIPSSNTHQDILEVTGAYGIPETFNSKKIEGKIISKSESTYSSKIVNPKVVRIISSSKKAKSHE